MTRSLTLVGLVLLLNGCATDRASDDFRGIVATQVSAQTMSRCIGQSTGAVPAQAANDIVIATVSSKLRRQYTIRRTKQQTVVVIRGEADTTRPTIDPAVQCAATLAISPGES